MSTENQADTTGHNSQSTRQTLPQKQRHIAWDIAATTTAAVALICSGISAFSSCRSSGFAARSAEAAMVSANSAKTNADWVTYQRTAQHDVIARVLKMTAILRGLSEENTNGLAYVDLALINNGNQNEIIRRVCFYYAGAQNPNGEAYTAQVFNSQLPKGDKQVLHLTMNRNIAFSGKTLNVEVGVTAIGPNAEDLESRLPAGIINIATDGNGALISGTNSPPVRVVSNERLPHQKNVEHMMP